ncbi:hypothetical protein ABT158_45140 [Nonomuraea sp. NPDC001636]|uniref:hypothetical protein n=1 Tax=Nonomuraea sp. NPDC001636 TaxID=3154391 RepID=UPI00332B24F1
MTTTDLTPQQLGGNWLLKAEADYDSAPSGTDYTAYAKAVMVCAKGDGEISTPERDWILGFFAALGATPELLRELRDYQADDSFESLVATTEAVAASTRALPYYALRACSADGELHPGEIASIRAMNALRGFPDDLVDSWLALHEEEQRLRTRRLALIWPDPSAKPY